MISKKLTLMFTGTPRWIWLRRLRITTQWVSFGLFIFFLAYSPLSEIFFKLNPFVGLHSSIASRTVLQYFWPSLIIIILTVLFGRVWCGWICPLGTVLDCANFKKKKKAKKIPHRITWVTNPLIRKHDRSLRSIKYILLIMTFTAALFGNLTLLILEPITIITRTFTISILPLIHHIITEIQLFFYNINLFTEAVDFIDSLIRGTLIPLNRSYFIQSIPILLFFAGIILLNTFAHRFWCRYLCPFGAFLGIISKFSLFNRQVNEECSGCNACNHSCNMDAIHNDSTNTSDPGECTLCLDCFIQCPKAGIRLSLGNEKKPSRGVIISRKNFLLSIAGAAVGVGLLKGDVVGLHPQANLIRPPGVLDEEKFLSACIRCGECMKVCPTSGLQPTLINSGLGSLWTPQLVPKIGACDYNCNLCGQVCPTGAIPTLTIEVKQKTPLGKAIINHGRCLEWADNATCLICGEFCPLPRKAIERRKREETDQDGNTIVVHGPVVFPERCIGCGICENLCPVEGKSAIHVERKSITT